MTRNCPIYMLGAGGHSKVLLDILISKGKEVLGCFENKNDNIGANILGIPILGSESHLLKLDPTSISLVNGIGDIATRKLAQKTLEKRGWLFESVVHSKACISKFSRFSEGCQFLAGSVINAESHLNEACIINTSAVIEHDTVIGSWSHIAPGAIICGGVNIGKNCLIGAGSVIREGLMIGDNTIVGAGSVVVKSFNGNGVLVGSPAKEIEA